MTSMKTMTRRDVFVALPTLAAAGVVLPHAFAAQNAPTASTSAPPVAGGGTLGPARAIAFDSVTAAPTANGGDRRVMLHGTLATGEPVELHQSMQTPGTPAPALHVIHHSEMILVREGTLKFQHEVDGKIVTETAGGRRALCRIRNAPCGEQCGHNAGALLRGGDRRGPEVG